jgi:hypothetical protein
MVMPPLDFELENKPRNNSERKTNQKQDQKSSIRTVHIKILRCIRPSSYCEMTFDWA